MSKAGADASSEYASKTVVHPCLNNFHSSPKCGYDGSSPYNNNIHGSMPKDPWNNINDAIAMTGYQNGCDGIPSPTKKLTPSSPLYNRNLSPYISPQSESFKQIQTEVIIEEAPPLPSRKDPDRISIEQLKVEELLAMCSEYERQAQLERNGRLTQNRIKTNGSLPREKRLNSPASPAVHKSFSFDSSDAKIGGNETEKNEVKLPHSYENVIIVSGSPRPRIKTIPTMDGREFSFENTENRIPLCLDSDHNQSPSPYLSPCQFFPEPSHFTISELPQPIVVPIVNLRNSKENLSSEEDNRSSIAEMNANNKYNFLGFDPRKPEDIEEWREESINTSRPSVLNSSPSWVNPKLDLDNYPDYDTVDSPTDHSRKKLSLPLDNSSAGANSCLDSLKMERNKLMKRLAALKSKVSDIELQEDEQLREAEIESALVFGEINAQKEKIREEEERVIRFKAKIKECEIEMEKCLAEQEESQRHFRVINDKNQIIIQTLEKQLAVCDNKDLQKELKDSLSQQIELLDSEKKAHEDLEFRLMEEEAGWLSRKEDIQKELIETSSKLKLRKEKLANLEAPSLKVNSQLEMQRIVHLKAIEKDRSRLKEVNKELQLLSSGFSEMDSCDSTTDEEVRVQSAASVDDFNRICRITSTTPIDVSCNSLGRKTIASLQEIERNRHLHMAKQGSLVIQEERQRVEELKKRVQDEVRAQWEQRRSTQSLASVNSDEPARDSGLGSDEPDKRVSPDEDSKPVDDSNLEEASGGSPESRPLSDASTYSEDQVKLRQRNNPNLQRPLTRYLPIRSENLDLRRHISEAGHQVDLCSTIAVDSVSCRGYLQKLGNRWPKWNKRWFVFDRSKRCLAYYSDKTEKKLRGGAYFQAIEEVYVDHLNSVKSPSPKVTFVVKSANRTFHLVAPSPEAMRIWVDVIFTGAEGYQQYNSH